MLHMALELSSRGRLIRPQSVNPCREE